MTVLEFETANRVESEEADRRMSIVLYGVAACVVVVAGCVGGWLWW